MKKFYIRVINNSEKRGYNRTISVYSQSKEGFFKHIGTDDKINTSSYRGDLAIASTILNKEFGFKWLENDKGYMLKRKDIRLIYLP